MITEVLAKPVPMPVPVEPIAAMVLPDQLQPGSSELVPGVEQLVCKAGVEAVIHPTGAASKYLQVVPQAEPVEVKSEEAT
jgi:hypothetical protein